MQRCIHEMTPGTCATCDAPPEVPRCRQCRHPLNDVLSIFLGVGPTCFQVDDRAQAFIWAQLPDPANGSKWGPMPLASAKNWTRALAEQGTLRSIYRTRADGIYIYLFREDEGSSTEV